ncbi:ring finger domain-containing protein 7 [Elsinoe australis]|uniref:RING-type E3 ubiquitin transferase n=1 Tax=Elsinoe australis TaxID=40998 RepID=A0A4U7ARA1_9PEZI|nr:ring finger domain-containing protein 7 [Elsinoe australis]
MRPVRLVLTLSLCLFTVLLLSYIAARRSTDANLHHEGRFRAMFDWRAPSSLFPPSAIISLTDDNSTFFLARPANFGPLLPTSGLSGQLWIGSGFGDDDLSRGSAASAEGELGCSDVPGWSESGGRGSSGRASDSGDKNGKIAATEPKAAAAQSNSMRRRSAADPSTNDVQQETPSEEDGTDDHLHHPLTSSETGNSAEGKKQGHADIQSLQESAEIAGKVVLLSRGGCGFLEKVKWVQRRGGTALIVGDNIRGGALVTMYARGDTSNVTIPSLFTSHTTAHLLSSLIPSGGLLEDITVEDVKRLGLALGGEKPGQSNSEASVKTTASQSKADSKPEGTGSKSEDTDRGHQEPDIDQEGQGWLRSLFSSSSSSASRRDNHRPPSSGHIDWVLQKDFDSAEDAKLAGQKKPASKSDAKSTVKGSSDGFKIGVQDWRDPDLIDAKPKSDEQGKSSASKPDEQKLTSQTSPSGGSITPGSGEYGKQGQAVKQPQSNAKDAGTGTKKTTKSSQEKDSGERSWIGRFKSKPSSDKASKGPSPAAQRGGAKAQGSKGSDKKQETTKPAAHEGLWVTLSPTTMSSSPFFDTLLVLVVSPLVTLTVVYALLLLRSRIRRRRWRAPKSVVERLPVRTYHTIASSTATTSSAQVSPPGTPLSPNSTTPLLHSSARPISQRPRSRTTSEVPVASSSFANRTPANLSLDQIQEKREAGLMEWRRKYGGKQRECVVCLEEYVDGVSRVMSLPCGHEFHVECITPWLTTRRRTCPICKGDVVRSLARTDSNTPAANTPDRRYDSYDDDDDELVDGVQEQAVATRNDDPAAAEPLSREEDLEDLERGVAPDRAR